MEGRLNLPGNLSPVTHAPHEAQIKLRWETLNDVYVDLQKLGFTPVQHPNSEFPVLTVEDLTTTDSKQYTTKYAEILAWWRYAADQQAFFKSHKLQIKNEMSDIEVDLRNAIKGSGTKGTGRGGLLTKEDVDIHVGSNDRYRELTLSLQKVEQALTLIDSRVDILERSMRLLSRQVEIRRLDIEQGQVENHMPGRGGINDLRRPNYPGMGYGQGRGESG